MVAVMVVRLWRAVCPGAEDGVAAGMVSFASGADVEEENAMKTVVVYESMYGNTHQVAECIAEVARTRGDVVLVPVSGATSEVLKDADVLIVGGPTHAHGMTSSATRRGALADAPKKHIDLDPDAEGPGLRDWFEDLPMCTASRAVAFDTRFAGPPALTGRASKGIGNRLRHHGFELLAAPESFLVDKQNHLVDGEVERARRWASELLQSV